MRVCRNLKTALGSESLLPPLCRIQVVRLGGNHFHLLCISLAPWPYFSFLFLLFTLLPVHSFFQSHLCEEIPNFYFLYRILIWTLIQKLSCHSGKTLWGQEFCSLLDVNTQTTLEKMKEYNHIWFMIMLPCGRHTKNEKQQWKLLICKGKEISIFMIWLKDSCRSQAL